MYIDFFFSDLSNLSNLKSTKKTIPIKAKAKIIYFNMLKYIILALAFIGIVFFVLFKFDKLDKSEKKKSIYILIAVLILSLFGIISLLYF